MTPGPDARVEHPRYGPGRVIAVRGARAEVDFFGAVLPVELADLTVLAGDGRARLAPAESISESALAFRRAFEAVNLGVIPSPSQLIALTINGETERARIIGWLDRARTGGLCKVFFGGYGAGKSHHLQLVKATALEHGWVTAFVEFDPKAADPSKPQLIYREIMSGLEFPRREDGSRTQGFFGLVKEVRDHWAAVSSTPLFRSSPWFLQAFQILRTRPHDEDPDYAQATNWLSGASNDATAIRAMARRAGIKAGLLPKMPITKETAEVYVFHLAVLNDICRSLGYRGLALILDEAEHVRGYNAGRRGRANSLFDLLARAAHRPIPGDTPTPRNGHGLTIPEFWTTGPHFALFVGLTPGDTFSDPGVPLREACVFLHDQSDRIMLRPPGPAAYGQWCDAFFAQCARQLGYLEMLSKAEDRARIVAVLESAFTDVAPTERVMRKWIKLAALAPSILLCGAATTVEALEARMRIACAAAAAPRFTWEG